MLLGDLGARVIKVEHPAGGRRDARRGGRRTTPSSGMSAYYLSINRNKESIALDLALARRRRVGPTAGRRAPTCVVENFPPGGLERFGLSLAAMREANPRLVTGSVTGFGRESVRTPTRRDSTCSRRRAPGSWRSRASADGEPTKIGVAVSDLLAGCYAAVGVLGRARGARADGPRRARRDRPLLRRRSRRSSTSAQIGARDGRGGRAGTATRIRRSSRTAPSRRRTARSSWPSARTGSSSASRRCVGRPEWIGRRALTPPTPARVAGRAALESELVADSSAATRGRVWLARCRAAGIPAGPGAGPARGAALRDRAGARRACRARSGVEFVASRRADRGRGRGGWSSRRALDEHGERIRREFDLPRSSKLALVRGRGLRGGRPSPPSASATRSRRGRSTPPSDRETPRAARRGRGRPRSGWTPARASRRATPRSP